MSIYFLRHGQTDWNKAGRWQGRSDVPLNQTGLAQSEAVAAVMAELCPAPGLVVSSPKGRAQQTAKMVAGVLGVAVQTEAAFLELDLGEYEGQLTTDLQASAPEQFTHWLANHHRLAAPGGENIEQGMLRVKAQLSHWIQSAGEKDLIIVAHQAIHMCMKAVLSSHANEQVKDQVNNQAAGSINDAMLSNDVLHSYKQSNSQIDIWSTQPYRFNQRVEATDGR